MFLSSYRNTSGSLGEQEMLWEPAFLSSPKFYSSIETLRTCFLFLLQNIVTKKRKTTQL